MAPTKTLTVIMPFLNERATLRSALERLLKTDLPVPVEVFLVDDGSTDDGAETIRDLVDDAGIRLIRHSRRRGKGAAIRTAMEQTRGEILTVLDADLEYDPADYKELLRPILEGEARVVYGTRPFGAHTAFSFWFVLGNKFLALWASFLFNTWLSDVETCFKMAETPLWQSLQLRSNGFGVEAESTAKFLCRGEQIYEIPIHYRARTREEGKKLAWKDGLAALWILTRVRILGR